MAPQRIPPSKNHNINHVIDNNFLEATTLCLSFLSFLISSYSDKKREVFHLAPSSSMEYR